MKNNITLKTTRLIQHFESLHDGDLKKIGLQPKICPAGFWTVGWGHVLTVNGKPLHDGFSRAYAEKVSFEKYGLLDEAKADNLLAGDLVIRGDQLSKMLTKDATDFQFGAMLSLMYNIGDSAFKGSSVLRLFNQGEIDKVQAAFLLWDKATVNGKKVVLKGLVIRRHAETRLFRNYPIEYN